MTQIRLAHIVRHPIKSLGWQEIQRAALTQGRPLPFDRHWAVATKALGLAADVTPWQPKNRFVRGAAEGRLQAIRAEFDETTGAITLSHPECDGFSGTLPRDKAALLEWLSPLWPDTRPAPSRLVTRDEGGAFADVNQPYLAILNTATNTELGQHMGQTLSIHRWRANLWLDGLSPWAEFDLIGRTLQIGTARVKIETRITRCVATTFDPDTGAKNGDTLAALQDGWGHQDFGVYARVVGSGQIAIDDKVTLLP